MLFFLGKIKKTLIKYLFIYFLLFSASIAISLTRTYASDIGTIIIKAESSAWRIRINGDNLGNLYKIEYVPVGKHKIEALNPPYFPFKQDVTIRFAGETVIVNIDEIKGKTFRYDFTENGNLRRSDNMAGIKWNGRFSDFGNFEGKRKNRQTITGKWSVSVERRDKFKFGVGNKTEKFYAKLRVTLNNDSREIEIFEEDVYSVKPRKLEWKNFQIELGFNDFKIRQIDWID